MKLLAFILFLLLLLPAVGKAEIEAGFTWFDRPHSSCQFSTLPEYFLEANCEARAALSIFLAPADWRLDWGGLFLTGDLLMTSLEGEPGHAGLILGDFGGGFSLFWKTWEARLLLTSRHCFDMPCPGSTAVNSLTLYWRSP